MNTISNNTFCSMQFSCESRAVHSLSVHCIITLLTLLISLSFTSWSKTLDAEYVSENKNTQTKFLFLLQLSYIVQIIQFSWSRLQLQCKISYFCFAEDDGELLSCVFARAARLFVFVQSTQLNSSNIPLSMPVDAAGAGRLFFFVQLTQLNS